MNKTTLLVAGLTLCAPLVVQSNAIAQTCNYYAGQSVEGQGINVDLCSVSRASAKSVDFIYYLGADRVQSQANCEDGVWTTFPERVVHRPQSQATQNMLQAVCASGATRSSATEDAPQNTAIVFDPPSNVRAMPDGDILCSIEQRENINIYGSTGQWYQTDACGAPGFIHGSQIRLR